MDVAVSHPSVQKGEGVRCTVYYNISADYENIQVEIFSCGVANKTLEWSSGKRFSKEQDHHTFDVNTSDLSEGYHEVRAVKLHGGENVEESIFTGGRDFERTFFHVADRETIGSEYLVRRNVIFAEHLQEKRFLEGYDIHDGEEFSTYYSLVFMSGVLISKRIRIGKWEVVPYRGVDKRDDLHVVNQFLDDKTDLDDHFEYTDELQERARQSRPTLIGHFPYVRANSRDQVYEFVTAETSRLAEVLAILRGGSGEIFNVVILDVDTGQSTLHTPDPSYKGNLLTGHMSGEHPEQVLSYYEKMDNEYNRYLFSLYKQAIEEDNSDFEYLRYWQILESIYEKNNYDESENLKYVGGDLVYNNPNDQVKIGRGIRYKVYHLLYDYYTNGGEDESESLGQSNMQLSDGTEINYSLSDYVTSWYAFRNAAAHYGGFRPDSTTQKENFRNYDECREASQLIDTVGRDFILSDLKMTVKLILADEV